MRSVRFPLCFAVSSLIAFGCGDDGPTDPANTAPTASFTASPSSGGTSTEFQFDASGSSDDQDAIDVLQARWDWEDDNTWDTEWSKTKTAIHQYDTTGTMTIRLKVKDTGGLTATTTSSVTVLTDNPAPAASFTVSPYSGDTSTEFQFDASGSSDGQDVVEELQARWDWEDDGTWDAEWSTTKTATHRYGTTGTKTIRLEVKDTDDLTASTTRFVTVTGVEPTPGDMVLVSRGTYTMGDGVAFCGVDERQVTLTHDFYLGQYEVTNGEYRDALQWAYDHGYVTATESTVQDNLDGSSVELVKLEGYSQINFSGETFTVDAGKDDHAMVYVSWYGGGRLLRLAEHARRTRTGLRPLNVAV